VKKIIVTAIFTLLSISAAANAELVLTISGPSSIAVGGTATYSVSYSGASLAVMDVDIVVDDVLKGTISNVVVPGGPIPFSTVTPITGGFEVSIVNDSGGTLPSGLFTFDLTATGTAGQVIHVSMLENSFFDLNWNQITGTVMPSLDVTIFTPVCILPNIVNMSMTDANAALAGAGFPPPYTITYEPNCMKPPGTIDRQYPPPGTVPCGTPVSYVIDTNGLYVGRVFTGTGITTLTVTQAMIDKWNYLGRPNCWCCASQKRGNGIYIPSSTDCKVDAYDIAGVKNVNAWNKAYTQQGYNPCLDFDLNGSIGSTDLAKIKNAANWNKAVGCGPPCQ
jgi:hypothetical protein